MRIWDVDPGYLSRQRLLGEHRELHGLVAVISKNKKGYSRHPETLRWVGYSWALAQRHRGLVAEMTLRGYQDRSPVRLRANRDSWPPDFIDVPSRQMVILKEKYASSQRGRIPLPDNAQQLWRQHKYSVMARDQQRYRVIGKLVAEGSLGFDELALELVQHLRKRPSEGGILNAVQHMWGYLPKQTGIGVDAWPLPRLVRQLQRGAMESGQPYLLESTALGELAAWL